MESNRIFTNWESRCSGLSHLMTNLESISDAQLVKLKGYQQRLKDSITNPKLELTPRMKEEFEELKQKAKSEDKLPTGAKTHLDNVYNGIVWKRTRLTLDNKYTNKGKMNEQDTLELHSAYDGKFYYKNDKRFSNGFITGEPDNFDDPDNGVPIRVRDAKSNYDLDTFDKADLSTAYEWQLKGYSWLLKHEFKLDYFPIGELCYSLTNSPLADIENEKNSMFYRMGITSDEHNDKWLEVKQQIERNHIFDIAKFKKEHPAYIFENTRLDFDMPIWRRVKKFEVTTTQKDADDIKRRILLSRIYLVEKEIQDIKNQENYLKRFK